jgi:hypothetical protein
MGELTFRLISSRTSANISDIHRAIQDRQKRPFIHLRFGQQEWLGLGHFCPSVRQRGTPVCANTGHWAVAKARLSR